jgi:hypothetical protein
VRWVKDRTGRFPERPHYDREELDAECEQIINAFLLKRHGKITFPITTEDLTVLIEQAVEDLDTGADLSAEADDAEVEGVTEFIPGKRPRVRISNRLNDPRYENRLRTTLTHEYGHVKFHGFLFEPLPKPLSLFPTTNENSKTQSNKCKRESIVGAPEVDWMEWQAGYACGALLMPVTPLVQTVREFREENGLPFDVLTISSDEGQSLIGAIATAFQTSRDAARVRLLQKHILSEHLPASHTNLF